MINVANKVSLKSYNTFGIDVLAEAFANITSENELVDTLQTHQDRPLFILGGGSNMLLTKDIKALVIHINNKGTKVLETNGNDVIVEAAAGENWHEFVIWCIANDFGGVENLSLIPGNVGTAPIQNIGAYGVELKDTFFNCDAINIKTQEKKTFNLEDCNFGYRNSIFKNEAKNAYIITKVRFKLTKKAHSYNISYGAIKTELEKNNSTKPSLKAISDAVINIRQSKLPDPKKIGNSGSFFKNPVIALALYKELLKNFPEMPHYPISEDSVKVPAGWLIEKAGFKGKTFGNYGVHKNQALVLVNYGGAQGEHIHELALLINKTILRLFSIGLECEVNII
jgi:UDP-N-acetylmuramate dehydrogenase